MHDPIYRRSVLEGWRWRIRRSLFKRLTRDSLRVFTLGGDVISVNPQCHGVYEPQVSALIAQAAADGMNQFFFDVGANIGLIACQSGKLFAKNFLFEPNPQVLPILKANARLNLHPDSYLVLEFGLGAENGRTQLSVPKGNLGGAFIQANNHYSEDTLAQKDGFGGLQADNYEQVEIEVRDADAVFASLADSLQDAGMTSGVFKLDVEGYEPIVLSAILRHFGGRFRFMVVLECQAGSDTIEEIVRTHGSGRLYALSEDPSRSAGRWARMAAAFIQGGYRWRLTPFTAQQRKSDIVYLSE